MDNEIKEILDKWRRLEREKNELEARAHYWEKMYWELDKVLALRQGHKAVLDEITNYQVDL
jgi:hypothetical protein